MTQLDKPREGRHTLAIGMAAGIAIGIAANLARKAAVQAPILLAGEWDKALAAEHAAALALFDALEGSDASDTKRRTVLLAQLKHAIGKHALQEENAVYAMMRDRGMPEAADHLNHEHGYVKQYFFDLGEMAKDDPAWLPKLREFRTMIEQHMREEENDLFPRLRGELSDAQNAHLTRQMNKEGLKLA